MAALSLVSVHIYHLHRAHDIPLDRDHDILIHFFRYTKGALIWKQYKKQKSAQVDESGKLAVIYRVYGLARAGMPLPSAAAIIESHISCTERQPYIMYRAPTTYHVPSANHISCTERQPHIIDSIYVIHFTRQMI